MTTRLSSLPVAFGGRNSVGMRSPAGRDVVVIEAARTPVGLGHPEKGAFKDVHPNELPGAVLATVIDRLS